MTSYLLHQPSFSGFGVVCVACEQRNLFFFSVTLGGVSGSDKSAQCQGRRPISGTYRGRGYTAGSRSHQDLLVQLPSPDRAASVPLQLLLLGLGQQGEGRPCPFFWQWLFPSACRTTMLSPRNVYQWDDWHCLGATLKTDPCCLLRRSPHGIKPTESERTLMVEHDN